MTKFEKAAKLAVIRLANIYLEECFGEPPSPNKVLQEIIQEAEKYNEREIAAHWKEVNGYYGEKV